MRRFTLFNVYLILFPIAMQIHTSDLTNARSQISNFNTHMSVANKQIVCASLAHLQNLEVAPKPVIYFPFSILDTLLFKEKYFEGREALKRTIEVYKTELAGAKFNNFNLKKALNKALENNSYTPISDCIRFDLSEADLNFANMTEANLGGGIFNLTELNNANLEGAHLKNAYFKRAELNNATLSYANMSTANLNYANCSNAKFNQTILAGAKLAYSDLSGAQNLTAEQLSKTQTLYNATIDPGLKTKLKQIKPSLFKYYDWIDN
ncbi:pentapeptide repeat-containing protein [Desulfovibrio sp. JC022]|uniref:pentapeptide repeat-containing protein n=1 Tax=Desulfovibrio sp. JC022 TaxID=2593642 RepID=UPI0013D2DA06|nr:pentapeptide repeat-containing protein [Desulfovibrio sp. JC022]NDV24467.1 pentapeptide repeat-containing protein [Desulfovibrio sp. JC022]